jgi:hypothetical protein
MIERRLRKRGIGLQRERRFVQRGSRIDRRPVAPPSLEEGRRQVAADLRIVRRQSTGVLKCGNGLVQLPEGDIGGRRR